MPLLHFVFILFLFYFFYYVADYLAPTHNMELAGYLFALFYLFHALIGVFVLGFIFGKITQKRFASKKLIHSLWLAVFTFVVIFIIGGLDGIFSQMQFRSHQTTIDDFIFGISHPDTHYFAIGTFCSFFLGELHEYFILKKNKKKRACEKTRVFSFVLLLIVIIIAILHKKGYSSPYPIRMIL